MKNKNWKAYLIICLALNINMLFAEKYYVSDKGNDSSNSGHDTLHTFRTIGKAAKHTNPGDTVYVMNGIYTNSGEGAVVTITRSGTANAWIVFTAYPGHKPKISFNGWGGFYGTSVSYVEINGFEIIGNSDNITLAFANSNLASAISSGAGIYFRSVDTISFPHHIRILNNNVSKCGGAGIATEHCDYVTIDNNVVWGNAWYSYWGTNGISIDECSSFDSSTDYKILVTRNKCYDNKCIINYLDTDSPKAGNGITLESSKTNSYSGRILVANNIVYNNGGAGLRSYSNQHIDFINNTLYQNSLGLDYPSIYIDQSNDIKILNNIVYAASGKKPNSSINSSFVFYDFNIYFNGTVPAIIGKNDKLADPLMTKPTSDPLTANFQLKNKSKAINSGIAFEGVVLDISGVSRPQGSAVDIGAYEFTAGSTSYK